MSVPEGTANQAQKRKSERRAYERHPIHLPAEIVIDGVGARPCVVRDYCLGGMLLVFDNKSGVANEGPAVDIRLSANDLIGIHCGITLEGRQSKLRFKARIAHTDSGTAGIAFVNPDLNALQLIRQFARLNPAPEFQPAEIETNAAAQPEPRNAQDTAKIIAGCNRIVIASASRLMDEFHDVVTDHLFESAKEIRELPLQNAFFQAVSLFNTQSYHLKQVFVEDLKERVVNGKIDDTPEDDDQSGEFTAESLQLVEDKAFDKWLAMSSIVNKVESDLVELLSPLEKRLTLVFGKTISKENNPYGPSLYVGSLQTVLETLDLEHNVLIKCHDIFSKVFFEAATQLYTELNNFLIEQDVLPVIKRKTVHKKHKAAEEPVPTEPEKESTEVVAEKAEIPESVLPEPTKPAEQTPMATLPQQDLYALVGELRNLQQQLKTVPAYQGQAAGGVPTQAHAGTAQPLIQLPAYSKPELLEALSEVKFVRRSGNADESTDTGIAKQILATLQARHGGDAEKTIGKEEAYVIDVAENVFSSLLSDQQVANSVRPWIEKLGVPVIKMALLDKSLFVDKSHIVRQVINKLAELEILAEAEDDQDQQAIKRAFSWVVDLINNQFDGTTQVFNRAMQQLEMLNRIQHQSYEKNLKQVINEFMQEERLQGESDAESQASREDLKQDEWLRRVHRLKEGNWILFDTHSDEPKRLKVAWIAERSGKYVFVNVMGRKDRVLKDKQLAELFRTADAVVLDGVDEPVMDRAQYTMLQNLHKQLLYQASHDEMTGLINRREFEKSIKEAIGDAIRNETKHAICQFDIDKFKVVNTTYGYEAGDAMINQVVELVVKNISQDHILARTGADEFGLILQELALDDAMSVIDDIMAVLEEFRFEWNQEHIPITISAGLAMINSQSKDITTVLQSVENSCNLAKDMGGNRVQLFHTGNSKLARRKEEMRWSTKVDKALDEHALYLRCQKIIPIQPRLQDEVHYEILLGIPEELGGQSSLPEFILAAEHYNRILDVDRWVIYKTFHWLAEHEEMLRDISGFSVNLSGHSLDDDNLIDYIYQMVKETAVPIEKITFEITETAGISNLSDAADFITTVKGTGCRFSLDDFGSGMSSYAYLKSLPVDYLKIDGAFVRNLARSPSDYAIVKSICEIAHFMDKAVIAEYVEDNEIMQRLQEIGVDFAQGYGVEKPHRLDELVI